MSGMGGRIDRLLGALSADQEKIATVSVRDLARCLIACAVEGNPATPELEAQLGCPPGTLLRVHTGLAEHAREESNWLMQVQRQSLPKMARTSVPSVPRNDQRLQPLPPRLDGLHERRDGRPLPRVIRTKGDR